MRPLTHYLTRVPPKLTRCWKVGTALPSPPPSTPTPAGRCPRCPVFCTGCSRCSLTPITTRWMVAASYSYAFFCAKHLGAGQYYLMTIKDKAGNDFDGGSSYRLTVPANAPVRQYWSATAYDRATHALIRNQPG